MASSGVRRWLHQMNVAYPYNVVLPVENAIVQRDDVLHLLLALGADVNVGVQHAVITSNDMKLSLLDYVRHAISAIREQLEPTLASEPDARPSDLTGWKSDVTETAWRVNVCLDKGRLKNAISRAPPQDIKSTLGWLLEVEAALTAAGAKTWNEIFPDAQISEQDRPGAHLLASLTPYTSGFKNMYQPMYGRMNESWQEAVPKHMIALYDDLFDACWRGEDAAVRELCMPAVTSDARSPLQIAVVHNALIYNEAALSSELVYYM